MEYEVVYEMAKHPFPWETVVTGLLAAGSLILALVSFFQCRTKKEYSFFEILKIAGLCILCFIMAKTCIYTISYGGSSDVQYAKKYYNGEYFTIEGIVEEFAESNKGIASFEMEGKTFHLEYSFENPIPTGKPLKICYLPDGNGEYAIVKVEVKRE